MNTLINERDKLFSVFGIVIEYIAIPVFKMPVEHGYLEDNKIDDNPDCHVQTHPFPGDNSQADIQNTVSKVVYVHGMPKQPPGIQPPFVLNFSFPDKTLVVCQGIDNRPDQVQADAPKSMTPSGSG